MKRSGTVLLVAFLVRAIALQWAAVVSAETGTLTFEARAGVGGVARPGRWMPVRIHVDNSGTDVSGVLVVSWGDTEVRRAVALPSPSRQQFEVYVRTIEAEPEVRVALLSNGVATRSARVPVRIVPPSVFTTLCVDPPVGAGGIEESCDARVTGGALPTDSRGYDAFDRVLGSPAPNTVDKASTVALERWRALRALEESGAAAGTPSVTRPEVPRGLPAASRTAVAAASAAYVIAMIALLVRFGRAGGAAAVYVVLGVVIGTASAAAVAVGRVGPATAVVVRHATLLQQLPGETGAAVSMQAVAEFPAFDTYVLHSDLADAFFESRPAAGTNHPTIDEQGTAVLAGQFALAAKRPFALRGFTALRPLAITADDGVARVTNRSSLGMADCSFAEGYTPRHVGRLAAGQTVHAKEESAPLPGPLITCALARLPFELSASGRAVAAEGIVRLVGYAPASDSPIGRSEP